MRYRYFCAECPNGRRYGQWHNTCHEAVIDARLHQTTHPDHYPYVH